MYLDRIIEVTDWWYICSPVESTGVSILKLSERLGYG